MKRTIRKLVLVITALILIGITPVTSVYAQTTNQQTSTVEHHVTLCLVVVIIAASYVVYSVYKCIQASGLTDPPPPPAPTTNAPVATGHDLIFPGGGGGTNSGGTSSQEVFSPGISYFPQVLITNNDQANAVRSDISAKGWTDWQGNPYTWFYTSTNGPGQRHIQTSTNLVDWTDQTYHVNMWLSSAYSPDPGMNYFTNVICVLYDGTGTALMTNYGPVQSFQQKNNAVPRTAGHMFYRATP